MTNFKLLLLSLIFLLLFACGGKSKLDIDVSDVKIDLEIKRFDQELLGADLYDLRNLNTNWQKDYGLLYYSFLSQMLQVGYPNDNMITLQLEKYLTDTITQQIAQEMNLVFNDFTPFSIEVKDAFTRYKYYFSDSVIPKIVTFHSNFNAKAFPENHQLGIGLDLFLGKESEITKALPQDVFPSYIQEKMDKEYLVANVMKHWLYFKFSESKDFNNNGIYIKKDDFLNTIIHHGKILYLLDAMLPNKSIENKLEFTKSQLEWCEKSEKFLYQTLIEKKLIYTKNYKEISRFINPGPFTNGFPESSPSGVGKWIGYQMVKQYMEGNDISIAELVSRTNDSRRILSYYRI
jgi:hypothetical protein